MEILEREPPYTHEFKYDPLARVWRATAFGPLVTGVLLVGCGVVFASFGVAALVMLPFGACIGITAAVIGAFSLLFGLTRIRCYRVVVPERADEEPHVIAVTALPPFRRRIVPHRRFVICRVDLEAQPAFRWSTLYATSTALLIDDRTILLQVSHDAGDSDAYIAALPDALRRHVDLDNRLSVTSHWAGL